MSYLRGWVRVMLFFSAYTPLFIILLANNYFSNNIDFVVITIESILNFSLIVIIIIPNFIIYFYIKHRTHADNPRTITIKDKENMNKVYFEYIGTNIVPFISFYFEENIKIVTLLIILFFICIVYINSSLLYANIMFNFFGYNLFKIKDANNNEYMLLSKRRHFILNQPLEIKSISDNFVIKYEVK